ncbi:hypothetical protein V6N11_076449 [Hibiscus sabdariffa]|uniref:Reverse transcriptase zinc-binding domain-containing protein n=1 Tax=Hibiscus sabdariffa TaxID=183260 RepID=A0ABR2Q6A1_9ROSI
MHKLAFQLVSSSTSMWVTTLRQNFRDNIFGLVGDGHDVHLWNDTWVPNLGPLRPWLTHALSGIDHMHFADMLQADSNSNTSRLSALLDPVAVPCVIGVLPPSLDDARDIVAWRCTPTGVFTVASAYASLLSESWDSCDPKWACIWSLPVAQRVRMFLWLVLRQRLLTNVERLLKRRNDLVFNGECLPLSDIYRIGFVWASHFVATIPDVAMGSHADIDFIQWVVPPHDWVSLNIDADVSSPYNFGAIGGVICGPAGAWLRGYSVRNRSSNENHFDLERATEQVIRALKTEGLDEMSPLGTLYKHHSTVEDQPFNVWAWTTLN